MGRLGHGNVGYVRISGDAGQGTMPAPGKTAFAVGDRVDSFLLLGVRDAFCLDVDVGHGETGGYGQAGSWRCEKSESCASDSYPKVSAPSSFRPGRERNAKSGEAAQARVM